MKQRFLFAVLFFLLGVISFTQYVFKTPDLTIIGFIDPTDGLGRQSKELIDTFHRKFTINFIPTRNKKQIPTPYKNFVKTKFQRFGKVVIFEDMLWRPGTNYYKKIKHCDPQSIKLAYSMWESTEIPKEWVTILNTHFDGVLVPSDFLIEVYQKSGVTIPIFELPLGLNLQRLERLPLKTSCKEPFVFGNLSVCSDRKNQVTLVRAFAQAFGNDPSVALRINCRYGEKSVEEAIEQEIESLSLTNVQFTKENLTADDYLDVMRQIDCYVSPSKGEGFSIQPREAMALGIPVIITDNTGQSTIARSNLVKTISSPILEKALYPFGSYYGNNFNCSIEDLATAMQEIKKNYTSYLYKGRTAREWAMQYDYAQMRPFYESVIHPKTVVLSDKNSIKADAIYTVSEELFHKYLKLFSLRGCL